MPGSNIPTGPCSQELSSCWSMGRFKETDKRPKCENPRHPKLINRASRRSITARYREVVLARSWRHNSGIGLFTGFQRFGGVQMLLQRIYLAGSIFSGSILTP